MEAIRQEHSLGCAVACCAFVIGKNYKQTLSLFKNGEYRVENKANFYFQEMFTMFSRVGKQYKWQYVRTSKLENIDKNFSIVFIEKSARYQFGHFLCRYMNNWMDPWINFPDGNYQSGFRADLPGKIIYVGYEIT